MPKQSQAAAIVKAADKVQFAQKRVGTARRELAKAEKAQERADRAYLDMVTETLAARQQPRERQEENTTEPS